MRIDFKQKRLNGFTIVELLIVIAVIGILAAVTIVSYNGIQQNAKTQSVKSDLTNASGILALYYSTNNQTYPNDTSTLSGGGPLAASPGTNYQYHQTGTSYCLTGTNGTVSYNITDSTDIPVVGGCPGDGVGGVPPIKNLVINPRGIGSSIGWFTPISTLYVTETTNVSWNGRSDWHRFVWNGTNYSTTRLLLNLSDLTNGSTYTFSVLLGNSGTAAISGTLDFNDVTPGISFTLQPGESRRIYSSASRATYDSTFRFLDINPGTGSDGVLVTDVMVTEGTTQYNYADGNSPNWAWSGTANGSTSTGPPL